MPQEDHSASELNHPEEILWVVFPANDDATKVMKPSEKTLDLPAAAVTTQAATVLRCGGHAHKFVRRDQLHAVAFLNALVQRVAVISAVADHSLGSFPEEALLERGFDLVLVGPAASGFPNSEHFIMREQANSQSDKPQDLMDASIRDPFLIVPGHDAARKRLRELLTASPQDLTHADMPLPEKPNFPYVRELRMPTLILIGSGDIADNQAIAGALVMAIPGATRVVVPDAGHLMYLEKPEVFSGLVSAFLTAHAF
jgi:pimeloyl-ACP methyl ester carboxylesterase